VRGRVQYVVVLSRVGERRSDTVETVERVEDGEQATKRGESLQKVRLAFFQHHFRTTFATLSHRVSYSLPF
jgi:hypothetical protein